MCLYAVQMWCVSTVPVQISASHSAFDSSFPAGELKRRSRSIFISWKKVWGSCILTALLSLSGPVEESCYVTPTEERLQRKKAAGETCPDLQVQPLWEDGLLSTAAPCVRIRYQNKRENRVYWIITSLPSPPVARKSKWVDPSVLAQGLSVL